MTVREPIVLIGAGGFSRETVSLIDDLGGFEVVGFLDDDASLHGSQIAGLPVVGLIDEAANLDTVVVVTTGSPSNYASRRAIVERLTLDPARYATLIHPSVVIGRGCSIGHGTVIHAGCVLTADVGVGNHVAMMPHVVLTHDARVGDFVTFGAGALVAGGVAIGDGAYIGSGARIREDRLIGVGSLVGMGSVVVEDVPSQTVWVGVPAQQLRP